MVRLTHERLKNILELLSKRVESRELFERDARGLFLSLGDDPQGIAYKNALAEAMACHKFVYDFVTQSIIETIQRLNHPPLTHSFAKRLPEDVRKVYFPEMTEAGAPGMGTTTANVGAYPIPLGSLAPSGNRGPDYFFRKKKKKSKKR